MPKFKDELYVQAFGENPAEDLSLVLDTWNNNGFNVPTQTKFEFTDLMATSNSSIWMPKVIEEVAREPVEPMLIIPSLLDRVQYSAAARYSFPAIGALVAYDLAPAQAYPEQTLNIAPGTVTINVGKTGIAFAITEEMIRYSQYDVMSMHIRAARRALDRHKEQKGWAYISGMGQTLFDNLAPTTSVYGTCTGRNMSGAGNGSCRMEDLLKAYSYIMMSGFVPNTLIMHPMTWSIWMTDPLLQSITKNTGNGAWFQRMNMPKSARPWQGSSMGGTGLPSGYGAMMPAGNVAGETPTNVSGYDQNLNSAAVIPSYFPFPLNVVVSPFAPFNPENNTADIMICDSSNLGAMVVDHDVLVDQWEDLSADTMKIKLKERYAFQVYEDGLAIGVLRNVPIKANEIAFPLQATISSTGSLADLNVATAISL